MKRLIVPALVAASFLFGTADAKPPKRPNLEAAHELVMKAMAKVNAAEKASEDKLGGHGQKALDLLSQANDQLQQAIDAANAEDKH